MATRGLTITSAHKCHSAMQPLSRTNAVGRVAPVRERDLTGSACNNRPRSPESGAAHTEHVVGADRSQEKTKKAPGFSLNLGAREQFGRSY